MTEPAISPSAAKTPLILGSRGNQPRRTRSPWKVLVVDDDEEIHVVSMMVLKDLQFDGRGVTLITAHSGEQARRLIAEHPDTAIMMVDVVMETEHAGLDLVRHVREELGNRLVRIILRTGQPGQAPEKSVIVDFDINDYREKTELTAQKLVTTVVSALRSYRDLQTIEKGRRGLEQIVLASAGLFELKSLMLFAQGVLDQVTSLFNLGEDSFYVQCSGFTAVREADHFLILAGTGQYSDHVGKFVQEVASPKVMDRLQEAWTQQKSTVDEDFVGFFRSSTGTDNLVYVKGRSHLSEMELYILKVMSINLAVAFDNVHLHRDLSATQEELIHTLSEVVETRSPETGQHVKRIGEAARLLGLKYGLSEAEAEILRIAAPMHDLGKIGIADQVLNKPGTLEDWEREIINGHPAIGHKILQTSQRPVLRTAAIIAQQHHERWDGKGYPTGSSGENIHIFGRIVALLDVFDALAHDRVYKKAWPMEEVIDHIRTNRGTAFDPKLVDLFLGSIDEFLEI